MAFAEHMLRLAEPRSFLDSPLLFDAGRFCAGNTATSPILLRPVALRGARQHGRSNFKITRTKGLRSSERSSVAQRSRPGPQPATGTPGKPASTGAFGENLAPVQTGGLPDLLRTPRAGPGGPPDFESEFVEGFSLPFEPARARGSNSAGEPQVLGADRSRLFAEEQLDGLVSTKWATKCPEKKDLSGTVSGPLRRFPHSNTPGRGNVSSCRGS